MEREDHAKKGGGEERRRITKTVKRRWRKRKGKILKIHDGKQKKKTRIHSKMERRE